MSHYFLTSSISQLITVKFEWHSSWFHFCRRLKRITFVFFAKWKKTNFVQWSNIYMKGLTPKEIKAELDNVHSTCEPAFAIVYNWMNLNVVVHPHVMNFVQLRLLLQKSLIKSMILFLIDEWKCVSLLRPAYHMVQWFQFCTNNWVRKSYRQDGCRVCSLWIISATVWRFQNNVWRCFNIIQNFCVDSLLWMKHGSITSHPRRKNSQNNGFHRMNQLRRRRRP